MFTYLQQSMWGRWVNAPFLILLIILCPYENNEVNGQCSDRANQQNVATQSKPIDCTDPRSVHYTEARVRAGTSYLEWENWQRTNSIQDFCVLTDMFNAQAKTPLPLRQAPKDCYPVPPKSATPPPVSHSAGMDPNWAILEHLVQHKAQSFQPFDDLAYVQPHLYEDRFIQIDPSVAKENPLPAALAPNPYFVEVTGISLKGELLHNFLHFRIFANLSVALGKDSSQRGKVLHGKGHERPNYAVGRISAALIMVKDQDGWPIGHFSTPIPCKRTCSKYSHDTYYGDERNAVPCSFTPPYSSSHPEMFVFDVDPGRYCTKPFSVSSNNNSSSNSSSSSNSTGVSDDPRLSGHTSRNEGVREIHATWSFGHSTCNFAERLYIQTLIFEDVETVYPVAFKQIKPGVFDNWLLFGWSAQYNVLKPHRSSLGYPDYIDLKYFQARDARAHEIDCHVPLFDSEDAVASPFEKLPVPTHENIIDAGSLGSSAANDIKVPSRLGYLGSLTKTFIANKAVRYFGHHGPKYPGGIASSPICRPPPKVFSLTENEKKVFSPHAPESVSKFLLNAKNQGIRCPCPLLASTLPPENRTADPARLYGRLIHASHMAIAYMLLTPIGCFVARYYKETFVTVFCFQEYWWYMWHVVTLLAACLFNIGAITSIARKKSLDLVYNDNLLIHVILGAMSIFVFYMEIITGFCRVSHPKKRMRQIFMHWLIGMTNNLCAVMSMYAMAWVDQSGFSCKVAYTVTFWLIFVIVCYVLMEVNMRKTDKKLNLIPRRTYLPPPVKRLFTKEPPGRMFRLVMLGVFIIGLIIIQFFVSYHIWDDENGVSCHEEYLSYYHNTARYEDELDDEEGGAEEGDHDEDP